MLCVAPLGTAEVMLCVAPLGTSGFMDGACGSWSEWRAGGHVELGAVAQQSWLCCVGLLLRLLRANSRHVIYLPK